MTSLASRLIPNPLLAGSVQQKMTPHQVAYDIVNATNDISAKSAITVDGTFEVQGRDVLAELDEMRDALMLIKRDVDMEAKYPKLKELKDAYAAQLAKYKTFDAIKDSK
jgi:predicted RNA-binding protein with PIN domain